MTTAAIYCRLSWAPDGSLEKVERQEADARALAERIGWTVSEEHVFVDNSVSAWKRDRKRPAWDKMLEAIKDGEVDAIIVYHGDRLVRQPWDLELLLRLADERRLQLASVSGMRDLSSADDRFILRVEVAQACRESDNISRRTRRGWEARAAKGLPIGGGKRPFGFEADGKTIRKAEADVLAEAAERLLAGQTLGGVLAWMNSVSTTSQGNRWTGRALKQLLVSPRVAGLVVAAGKTYQAVWEPIISPETQAELKALLETKAQQQPHRGSERRYLLSGIAECCRCSGKLGTKPSGGRNRKTSRIYFCRQCKSMGRNVAHLDAYVSGRVLRVLNDRGFLEELTADASDGGVGVEIAALERRRDETRAQLERLADHPELSPELIVRSLESFDRKINELRSKQVLTTRQRLLTRVAGISEEGWQALPLDMRSEVIRSLFRVVVLPATWRGPGFDPASVQLTRV